MVNRVIRIISFGILVLLLSIPAARAQNTKGDKPTTNRETRFKTPRKEKPAKRVKSKRGTTSSLRAYKPRKKSKGGERAGRALAPTYSSRPSEKPRNVYPQSSPFVHNPSKRSRGERFKNVYPQSSPYANNRSKGPRGDTDKKRISRTSARARVVPRSATGTTKNVYSQSGRFVSHSSSPADRKPGKKRRVAPRSASRSFTARRSVNAWAIFPKQKQKREKANTKDIAGRRLRTRNFESKKPPLITSPGGSVLSRGVRRRSIYPSSGRISATPGRRNVYTQSGRYVNNYARQPKKFQAGRTSVARVTQFQGTPDKRPGKKRKIVPRSSSRPFMARRSTNMWARFPRPKKKGERAITTDIAGKPLRTKNFETQRPEVMVNPTARPYQGRKRVGDRPYKGTGGGYATATRSGKAWSGDVAGRRIRKNYTSKKGTEGRPISSPEKRRVGMRYQGEGFSGNIRGRRFPGDQGEEFTGAFRSRRSPKGGGSVSGKLWNNRRQAIPSRAPGIGGKGVGYSGNMRAGRRGFNNQGEEYSGNIKARRPLKGGGSASGKLWNNRRQAIPARAPGIGGRGVGYSGNIRSGGRILGNQGEEYTGHIKARRPLRGGGSVSGKLWNNRQTPVPPRAPGIGGKGVGYSGNIRAGRQVFNNQGEEYTGHVRARRPLKGGGSVSGKLWNNRQTPVPPRAPGIGGKGVGYSGNIRAGRQVFNDQGEEYTGHIRARRPLKGGGSVSGKLWNNRQTPVPPRAPGIGGKGVGYSGNIRAGRQVFNDQGEEYTGHIRARRPLKGGGSVSGKLWNNKETPIAVRTPSPAAAKAGNYTGNIRGGLRVYTDQGEEYTGHLKVKRKYVQNPNAAEAAPKKRRPATTYDVDGLQVRVKRPEYGRRKDAPEGSIPGLKPTKATIEASRYALGMKAYKYVKNPSSAEDAVRVREVGKAFARATDYQGNIKMRKFELFGKRQLHPDAQFVRINKNNVDEEKDMLTNFKLWWSRLFRKNETVPDHLKDKRGKPRYDRGEQGLWYD